MVTRAIHLELVEAGVSGIATDSERVEKDTPRRRGGAASFGGGRWVAAGQLEEKADHPVVSRRGRPGKNMRG